MRRALKFTWNVLILAVVTYVALSVIALTLGVIESMKDSPA